MNFEKLVKSVYTKTRMNKSKLRELQPKIIN